MSIAEQEERFFANVFQRNGPAPRELVLLREYSEKRLGKKRNGFEFVAANGKGENGNVHAAGAKAIQKYGGDFLDDGELHLGKFSGEGGEHARKQIRRDSRNGTNDHGPGYGIFLLDHVTACGLEFAQDGARPREKCFSEFGETHGTAETVEEPRAEFVLEFQDLLRKRGLRDVRLLRGTRERAGVSNGAEVAELAKFDKAVISDQTSVLSKRSTVFFDWGLNSETESCSPFTNLPIGNAYPFYLN